MKKKPSIIKDALVLFVITLLAGLLLGGVYSITKEPIADAKQAAKDKAYQEVLPAASTFTECFESTLKEADSILAGLEGVKVDGALAGKNAAGEVVGYVVLSSSSKSYGGVIALVVGMDVNGVVTGTSVLTINDTPGLGMKAKDEDFRAQYVGKDVSEYTVVKTGASADGDINAISSATITSKAFTGAVNGAKLFLKTATEKEGGAQ